MDFAFTERRPTGRLGAVVESIWHARGQIPYARERIAPTGSTVAGIVLGPPIRQTPAGGRSFLATSGFLIGPHDRPLINEPTGFTDCVGVVTTPVGCGAVLGMEPRPLRGRVVDLLGRPDAGSDVLLDRTETALLAGLEEADHGLPRCAAAVAALEADPNRPVSDVAAALGISHGHLDRKFTRVVGLSPRTLARVLRVQRLLAALDVTDRIPWARLAADHGWYDQAHLVRDFTAAVGAPPARYAEHGGRAR